MLIALASAGSNPRAGRTGNLFFAFMVFVLYFNFLVLGRSWVESGKIPVGFLLLALHGGAFLFGLLMLAARHNQWTHLMVRRR
jgi:lipopolysaccharide export system permease protein